MKREGMNYWCKEFSAMISHEWWGAEFYASRGAKNISDLGLERVPREDRTDSAAKPTNEKLCQVWRPLSSTYSMMSSVSRFAQQPRVVACSVLILGMEKRDNILCFFLSNSSAFRSGKNSFTSVYMLALGMQCSAMFFWFCQYLYLYVLCLIGLETDH